MGIKFARGQAIPTAAQTTGFDPLAASGGRLTAKSPWACTRTPYLIKDTVLWPCQISEEEEGKARVELERCLDRAAMISTVESKSGDYSNPGRLCIVTQAEELKVLTRMFPIWATRIVFAVVYAQMPTLFVEQGTIMNTSIGSFNIPPASLSTFDLISIIVWVPLCDRIIVPIARIFTGKERGFSELQRMGIGLFISVLCMSAAAVVEIVRLQLAKELDIVDKPAAVPLSIFWRIPQYFLLGAAEVFTFVGQLEFFYDQFPDAMRSLCSALSLLATPFFNAVFLSP